MNKKIILVLLLTIIFICSIISIACAKYIEIKTIKAETQIAKPILELEKSETIKLDDSNKEGQYKFSIKNYNTEGEVSDVIMNYTIEISSKAGYVLEYTLEQNGKQIPLINGLTKSIQIGNKQKEIHNYILTIKYIKEKSNEEKNLLEDIQLNVNSYQKRGE